MCRLIKAGFALKRRFIRLKGLHMKRRLSKKDVLTIPNLMSFLRIALIPLYLWLYCVKEAVIPAVCVLALSGITDIFDGIVARKFNMVSDFGKFIDPVADKLTQGALILSLSVNFPDIWPLFFIFVIKELTMALLGLIELEKTDTVNSAQWFGKATTVVLEGSMALLLLVPNIPAAIADGLFALCSAMAIFSLIMYSIFYIGLLTQKERGTKSAQIIISLCISVAAVSLIYFLK